jgi:hypothetical protein
LPLEIARRLGVSHIFRTDTSASKKALRVWKMEPEKQASETSRM